jgi:hypothetical protein
MRPILAIPLILLATSTAAQAPSLALAADFGPALPLGEFSDDGAELGWALGVSGTVRLTRLFGLYASYERTSFGVEDTGSNHTDGTWTDRGLGVGARLWVPVRDRPRIQPWAQLGLGWHDLDPPIAGPEFAVLDTQGMLTIEGGAGIDIALAGQVLFFRPTLRYRRYSFSVESPQVTSTSRVSYLALGVGLVAVWTPGNDARRHRQVSHEPHQRDDR